MKKKKQNKKKKLNSSGFTLIELLAVITIMGILMMVAIPAVSRTIENSRRDSFATIAQNYINSVRNSVLADELKCETTTAGTGQYNNAIGNNGTNVSAVDSSKTYFLTIDTGIGTDTTYKQQSADLMESGGDSSWGGAAVQGYVKWEKVSNQWKFSIVLRDKGNHGIKSWTIDQQIKRSSVSVDGVTDFTTGAGTEGSPGLGLNTAYECGYVG